MKTDDLSPWRHHHVFDQSNPMAERGTRAVMLITAVAMVIEIVAGWWFNSMALLADGWHMSSHTVAIGVSAFAYAAARRYARDSRFAFGTWKIEVLGGFASAIFLLGVAVFMVVASVERMFLPQPIRYQEAIAVAGLGLLVNVVCAVILGKAHHHGHGHHHDHGGAPTHEAHTDLNLKSAYLHVVADATTSVLAIVALLGGWVYGWSWLDPVMGIVGAVLVAYWAKGLLAETSRVLLDREMDHPVVGEIRDAIEGGSDAHGTRLTDLHVWRVGKQAFACAISVATHDLDLAPDQLRKRLAAHEEVVHATIEIHHLSDTQTATTPGI